ncbi:MAG: hypothetical protein JWN50_469 [Parcubacteria group bacterium]|nr:hypothetical protein [Parcubacteria group bacterium]
MNKQDTFKRIGLTENAFRVYSALEASDPLLITHIASHTGLFRTSVYRALEELVGAKLVRKVALGKRNAYKAESESRVKELFKVATKKVDALFDDAGSHRLANEDFGVSYLSGNAGIRKAFDDVIALSKRGETFYRITSEKDLDEVNRYLSQDYRLKRDKKRLEREVISNTYADGRKRPRLERFIKFMPAHAGAFDQDMIELIYGDTLTFIDLKKKQVISIKNASLADFQKSIFKALYRRL